MAVGLAAGLGAGAFWGMTFVAPLWAPGFGSVDFTVGRFLACGLFSLGLMLFGQIRRAADGAVPRWPTLRQAGAALLLSLLGYTGYYLLLVFAIHDAGPALPTLIIGTIPLWVMVLGKPQALRWAALVPGLLLTAAGMFLMVRATGQAPGEGAAEHLVRGVLFGVAAMASWTAFSLLNAAWLSRHPEVNSTDWANWLGVSAGLGSLLLWALAGSPLAQLLATPGLGMFVLVCVITGIGAAWVASVMWNMASRRLSPSLAGSSS